MISYYDLLTMIKNGNAPKKVKYDGKVYESKKMGYVCEIEEDYEYLHLSERFCENLMFDETIEIIEENKEIEKLEAIYKKINEIVDCLNEMVERSD